jgi:outer membrane protein TolC
LRGNWWELYQEPELNSLEEKLNTSNQNIAQSFQNFMAARAQVKQARASYYPTVSVGPSYTRGRTSGTEVSQFAGVNSNSNDFSLPFDVSWEPDVWGRIRNTVREYANAAQVSAADLANERLSQQANLAEYYFELRGQDALIDLYEKTGPASIRNSRLPKPSSASRLRSPQQPISGSLELNMSTRSPCSLGKLHLRSPCPGDR